MHTMLIQDLKKSQRFTGQIQENNEVVHYYSAIGLTCPDNDLMLRLCDELFDFVIKLETDT